MWRHDGIGARAIRPDGPWPHSVRFTAGGRQQALANDEHIAVLMSGNDGAGEGIRTLDPNLGKVVLYP